MISSSSDALVVGAGYIGCAVAYYLAAAGLRTALIDRGGVAAGASRANYGNIQIQDAELDHSLPMIRSGFACFQDLEEELGSPVGFVPRLSPRGGPVGVRRIGSLLLIETEAQWRTMAARLPALHAAGIQAEMVEADRLQSLEPLLDPHTVLGACYHEHEGQVNPFQLMWAFVRGGCRLRNLTLHFGHEVTGIELDRGRVRGISTSRGRFAAPVLVLCTGAWTPILGRALGREWSIPHVHGQAIVTEASALRLNNHISSAAFFESMHEEEAQPPDGAVAGASGGAIAADSSRAVPAGGLEIAVSEQLAGFFHLLDSIIGSMARSAGSDATIVFVSDHGFGPAARHWAHLNNWLLEIDLLHLQSVNPGGWLQQIKARAPWLRDIAKRVLPAEARAAVKSHNHIADAIDWPHTLAWAEPLYNNVAGIYLHRQDRFPNGVVSPAAVESLRQSLIDEAQNLMIPGLHRPLVQDIRPREDYFDGPYVETFPDLILTLDPDYAAVPTLGSTLITPIPKLQRTGDHRPEGIFLACGANTHSGPLPQTPSLMDVAPTLLHFAGLPIPDGMEGEPILDAFRDGYLVLHPPRRGPSLPPIDPATFARGHAHSAELETPSPNA